MLTNPFVFGKTVNESDFCNRKTDISFLHNQFDTNSNTILISPRRWGKSSLVEEAAKRYAKKNVRFIFLDLFKCRTPEEFYEAYVQACLKATNSKLEEAFQFATQWLKSLVPNLSFQPDQQSEFNIKFNLTKTVKESEILNLPQLLAEKKGLRIIVCLDEFQNIQHFPYPIEFQRKLRGYWQKHGGVHYCLYGSKRHLMVQLFESSDLPFYKFGAVHYLKKIELQEWIPFVENKFKKSGKTISPTQITILCEAMELHSYYVQQAFQILWYISGNKIKISDVQAALQQLAQQNELQFQKTVEGLTTYQLNYLKAICAEVKNVSSKESIKQYALGTTATVQRSIQALLQKDVIDTMGKEVMLVDPAFKWWFKQNFIEAT
ncbi:MAG: ATP-binding protein [Cytophagales bacterium]|nr:ATP-binding protein [Cytophagales bacterium]